LFNVDLLILLCYHKSERQGDEVLRKLKVYLDNCCYNRPYDDQTQLRIELETKAKLYIQQEIAENKLTLVSSVILEYENNDNPYTMRKQVIKDFLIHATEYVDKSEEVLVIAREISKKGVKAKDSAHTACAIISECDYLLTTDDKLLKYKDERIKIINPVDFIRLESGNE
jgi:predicted nucleic acid-binding protein